MELIGHLLTTEKKKISHTKKQELISKSYEARQAKYPSMSKNNNEHY